MLGNTTGKKALEKGSSSRVGSHNDNTAPNHCSGRKFSLRHSRGMSQAIKPKLAANKTTTPIQLPGRNMCCPARRSAAVAISHPANPKTNNLPFMSPPQSYEYESIFI
jgi:hypothetical protein